MISKNRVLGAAVVTGALVLTGCSDNSVASHMDSMESSTTESSESPAGEDASFNDADVAFAQGMIPHHEQAIEMARMAAERAEDPRVLDLASRIEAAQQPEIEDLTSLLDHWGVQDSSGAMDHGGMEHSGGMMSEEDITALKDAGGAEFDRLFLERMIEHHAGAVAMAEAELAAGENRTATAMAQTILDTQRSEIAEMEQALAELDG
jgi:uncharacterized protein (DUF305 family)